MTRTFLHSFDPPAASPVTGTTVDLEVSEIEDAGIREVLQTPGPPIGTPQIGHTPLINNTLTEFQDGGPI